MAMAAEKHVKSNPHIRWETLWIHSIRERSEFRSKALKCMREGKIDREQMVIFTCFADYGMLTKKLIDPSKEEGVDMDRGLVAGMDELCEIACNDLQIPAERVIETASLFVKLGLLQGLTLQRPR